ncbi:TIGR00730 family Rossman fold protein [Bacillus piscicola]|uniref:LOG family protein n=1 Tax=Bacillus piscicola TaxID=1632684 RepID=UPI001F0985E2|nr:TIGR00730 family Rossman fold protein [Bacillus piscicola]
MDTLTVFCGSSNGFNPMYKDAARQLGSFAAEKGIEIVYGGSSSGLMGAVADGALGAGGRVTGIIPEDLKPKEIAHQRLTHLITVSSMHERKFHMYERGNAFVALPGGIGTLEEFMEVLTWSAIGHHQKRCALFNTGGYYAPLQKLLDHMVDEGFLADTVRETVVVENDPETLLEKLF